MTAKEPDLYVARTSGVVKIKGKRRDYIRGVTFVRAGDPILKAVPDKFVPALPESRLMTAPERA